MEVEGSETGIFEWGKGIPLLIVKSANGLFAVSAWMYVACAAFVILMGFNLWRFRTGWRMIDPERPGRTRIMIDFGYSALSNFVASLGFADVLILGPSAGESGSTAVNIGMVASAAVFVGGAAVSAKERRRPSRWNRPPGWLVESGLDEREDLV